MFLFSDVPYEERRSRASKNHKVEVEEEVAVGEQVALEEVQPFDYDTISSGEAERRKSSYKIPLAEGLAAFGADSRAEDLESPVLYFKVVYVVFLK